MKRLYDIYDSHVYTRENTYMAPESDALSQFFDVVPLEIDDMPRYWKLRQKGGDHIILSRLKLRTLLARLDDFAPILTSGTHLFIKELDPWENFLVGSPYYGSYKTITDRLHPTSWIVQSEFYSKHIVAQGIPCVTARQRPRPFTDCAIKAVPWNERKHDVVFGGSMHGYRKTFFDALTQLGVNIAVRPKLESHSDYLEFLSQSKIMVRSERRNMTMDYGSGVVVQPYIETLWQRDVECASRGCFSLRELDSEGSGWGVGDLPTIFTFDGVTECADLIKKLLVMDINLATIMAQRSIDVMREANWLETPEAMVRVMEGK